MCIILYNTVATVSNIISVTRFNSTKPIKGSTVNEARFRSVSEALSTLKAYFMVGPDMGQEPLNIAVIYKIRPYSPMSLPNMRLHNLV